MNARNMRQMARDALIASGGRGFVRFLPAGGALFVSDAPRHGAVKTDALEEAGFLCREEDGLLYITPDDALLSLCGEGAQRTPVQWETASVQMQALADRFLREKPLPLTDEGRQIILETLRLLWQDERHAASGMYSLRARAAVLLRKGDRSGLFESGALLQDWVLERSRGK